MASGFSSDQVEKAKEAIGILSSIINPVQDEQVRHVYLYFCKINQRPCSSRSLSGNEPRPRSEGEHVVHVPRVAVASCGSC